MKKTAKILSIMLIVLLIGTLTTQKIFAGEDDSKGFIDWLYGVIQYFVGEHDQTSQAHCFVFDEECNVGIGTTIPESRLDVEGGKISDVYEITSGPGSGQALRLSGAGSVIFLADFDNDDPNNHFSWLIDDEGYAFTKMTLTEQGNLGIGTRDPQYKLDVEGDVQALAYYTGDIVFQKDGKKLWRMFEDEEGLYVENLKSGETFNFIAMQKQLMEQQQLILSLAEKVQALEASFK